MLRGQVVRSLLFLRRQWGVSSYVKRDGWGTDCAHRYRMSASSKQVRKHPMMILFTREELLDQWSCCIVKSSVRNVDYLPVQLSNGIQLCCHLSSKRNDSLRNGLSRSHLSDSDFPETCPREPDRRMARHEPVLLAARSFSRDRKPLADPHGVLKQVMYRDLQFCCDRSVQ